jgi:hypothetical protein
MGVECRHGNGSKDSKGMEGGSGSKRVTQDVRAALAGAKWLDGNGLEAWRLDPTIRIPRDSGREV